MAVRTVLRRDMPDRLVQQRSPIEALSRRYPPSPHLAVRRRLVAAADFAGGRTRAAAVPQHRVAPGPLVRSACAAEESCVTAGLPLRKEITAPPADPQAFFSSPATAPVLSSLSNSSPGCVGSQCCGGFIQSVSQCTTYTLKAWRPQ
jgi:hypothetical protein